MKRKDHLGGFWASVIFLAAVLLISSGVQAATIYVGQSETYTTIQGGIDAAVDGDTVTVRDGTYSPPDANGIDFKGKAITLRSENGASKCIIDGGGAMRGFYFHSGETAQSKLDGFTIQNCKADDGSGICCQSSSPTITNCVLSGSSAGYGGGIYCSPFSSPPITDCTLSGNKADYKGGGMYFSVITFPNITNCTFSGNSASSDGGGIYSDGYSSYSTLTITNCTLSGNSSKNKGGGIHGNSSFLTIINCTFTGNSASYGGGGIYDRNGTSPWPIKNCIFQGNYAPYNFGGGIWLDNSKPLITNCTFTGNWASYYSGDIYYDSNSLLTLTNCILWGSSPNPISEYGSKVVTYSNVQGGFQGEGNINADPKFYNASSGDFHLLPDSPCIDSGINTAPSIPALDKDGTNRITDGNGDGIATVDMGAYEYQGTSTGVRLASFKAMAGVDGIVKVTWRTATETDNAGFHLWRSHLKDGNYTRLTEKIIPAEGTPFEGARYRFEDLTTRHEKIYFYKLEDMDFEGKSTFHGPVRVRVK